MSLVANYHVLAIFLAQIFQNWPVPVGIVMGLSYFMDHTITMDTIGGLTGVLLFKAVEKDLSHAVKVDLIVAMGALIMRSSLVALLAACLTRNPTVVGITLAMWLASPWPDIAQCVALVGTLMAVTMHREVMQ